MKNTCKMFFNSVVVDTVAHFYISKVLGVTEAKNHL